MDYPPLQAADILAYETHKEMVNAKISSSPSRDLRKSATNLLNGLDLQYCEDIDRRVLDRILRKI